MAKKVKQKLEVDKSVFTVRISYSSNKYLAN